MRLARIGTHAAGVDRVEIEQQPRIEQFAEQEGSAAGRMEVVYVGLTVRIEVNLPPGGDAQTYDAIFASIKKHLMT